MKLSGVFWSQISAIACMGWEINYTWLSIIIYIYQLDTGGRTQEAKPVRGVYL